MTSPGAWQRLPQGEEAGEERGEEGDGSRQGGCSDVVTVVPFGFKITLKVTLMIQCSILDSSHRLKWVCPKFSTHQDPQKINGLSSII
jgi:hypothetical protein